MLPLVGVAIEYISGATYGSCCVVEPADRNRTGRRGSANGGMIASLPGGA